MALASLVVKVAVKGGVAVPDVVVWEDAVENVWVLVAVTVPVSVDGRQRWHSAQTSKA